MSVYFLKPSMPFSLFHLIESNNVKALSLHYLLPSIYSEVRTVLILMYSTQFNTNYNYTYRKIQLNLNIFRHYKTMPFEKTVKSHAITIVLE